MNPRGGIRTSTCREIAHLHLSPELASPSKKSVPLPLFLILRLSILPLLTPLFHYPLVSLVRSSLILSILYWPLVIYQLVFPLAFDFDHPNVKVSSFPIIIISYHHHFLYLSGFLQFSGFMMLLMTYSWFTLALFVMLGFLQLKLLVIQVHLEQVMNCKGKSSDNGSYFWCYCTF